MALGTGTHFAAPVLGSDRAQAGLCEEVPIEVQNRRHRSVLFYDFIDVNDEAAFAVTNITSGTATILATGVNGLLRLAATTANQGLGSVQFSLDAAAYLLASTTDTADGLTERIISTGARITINDWSDCDWFYGLGGTDTTFMDATGVLLATGGDNHVGFHHLVADAEDVRLSSAGTAVGNTQVTLLSAAQTPRTGTAATNDATAHEFGIKIVGTTGIEFYFDGILRHRRAMANALAAQLTPTFTMIANGALINFDVDYVWVMQTR